MSSASSTTAAASSSTASSSSHTSSASSTSVSSSSSAHPPSRAGAVSSSSSSLFSASDRSTWSRDEASFSLDLNAISVDSWSGEHRKALLFLIACCLPTVHNRARLAARRTARHVPLPELKATNSDGGGWEEEYLRGIATMLKLDPQAVQA